MKHFRILLLSILSIAFITSCKKAVPKQTAFIPKNALFVATINTKSLQSKLVKSQATIENIIRSISGSDTAVNKGKQEWEDLKASGIDLDENFYLAIDQIGGGMTTGKGSTITSAIGGLKDAAKLEAYIKKKDPASEVRKEKDYSYATVKGDNIVAWGKDVVIMMSYQRSMSPNDMVYDSTSGSFNLANPGNSTAELKKQLDNNFNLKEDETVAAIPEFRDLMQEKADASMWVNSTSSIENLPIPLPKAKELFANSFTAAKIDFEDGKISIGSRSYYSKELRDILKNYTGPTADLGLIEHYPSDNIDGFAVFSFNPEVINGIVKYLEVGGVVDSYLTKMMGTNYTLQQALKAIKGDFAIVVSDLAIKPATDTSTRMMPGSMPDFKMLMNIPVGDKTQMNRLMDKLVEMQMLVKTNNEYRLNTNMQRLGYQLRVDDKNVFIASDENLLNQYKTGSKKININNQVMSDFKGKSAVSYVNIESILNGINTPVTPQANSVLPKAKETFKDMEAYSENFNGKYLEGHAIVHFKNEKENSLTSLLSFIETVSKNVKTNPAMVGNDDDVQIDTVFSDPHGHVRAGEDVQVDTAYKKQSGMARSKKNK